MVSQIDTPDEPLLSQKTVREDLIKFSAQIAAVLAVPIIDLVKIYETLARTPRLPIVWLEFYYCSGESESIFSALKKPDQHRQASIEEGDLDSSGTKMLRNFLSIEYHASLTNPATLEDADQLDDIIDRYSGQYLCIIEGAIPKDIIDARGAISGSNLVSKLQNVTAHAKAIMAVGSCATSGNVTLAGANMFRTSGVREAVPEIQHLLNLPGCPVDRIDVVASIVYLITYGNLPAIDSEQRPHFAYGSENRTFIEQMNFYKSKNITSSTRTSLNQDCWCGYQPG